MYKINQLWAVFFICLFAETVLAESVAVTDLTYQERVQHYFHMIDYHNRSAFKESNSDRERDNPYDYSASSRSSASGRSQTDYTEVENTQTYIEFGELRKFTADIKGAILQSGGFQVVQAKPVTGQKSEKIYDIIDRIKKGYYPHADYVLFGTVSDVDFRDEMNPVINTNTMSRVFGLTLVAEFSLINTKTYEVTASFSATGEGDDVRMIQPGASVIPSRARVVGEVSKTLGEDVSRQLDEQLGGARNGRGSRLDDNRRDMRRDEGQVTVYGR